MSYYYKHDYIFSYHGLQRCKERLGLKNLEDFKVKEEVIKLIKKSTNSFEKGDKLYIAAGNNTQIYFVINKTNNLIITCTKISIERQISLLD